MIAWGGSCVVLLMDLTPGFILDNIAMVDEITHLTTFSTSPYDIEMSGLK